MAVQVDSALRSISLSISLRPDQVHRLTTSIQQILFGVREATFVQRIFLFRTKFSASFAVSCRTPARPSPNLLGDTSVDERAAHLLERYGFLICF